MRFNINDVVRVRLTPEGKAHHKARRDAFVARYGGALGEYTPPKEDVNGWSEWQLWSLMAEFGDQISLTGPNMFATEIEIPEKPNGTRHDPQPVPIEILNGRTTRPRRPG